MAVCVPEDNANPLVLVGIFAKQFLYARQCRRIVGDTKLPVWIELRPNGFNRFAQPSQVRVINRHDNGKFRLQGEPRDAFAHQCAHFIVKRVVFGDPIAVGFANEATFRFAISDIVLEWL